MERRKKEREMAVLQSRIATWLPTIVPALVLMGSILTAYYSIDKQVALVERDMITITSGYKEIDKYQRFLQKQIEVNDRKLLIVETNQQNLTMTQQALAIKVDNILVKLESVGNTLVRIQVQLEQLNKENRDA